MNGSSAALVDAGNLLTRTLDSLILDAHRAADGVDARIVSDQKAVACRSARQKLGSSLELIYVRRGIDPHVAALCRIAVERLGVDVLRDIFAWVVSSYDHAAVQSASVSSPIFLVAAVCRRWRTVAVTTPMLWTKVRLAFDRVRLDSLPFHLSVIMDRASGCELDMVVLVPSCDTDRTLTANVRAAVARVFGRCRVIQISWLEAEIDFQRSLLPLCLANMPYLARFSVKRQPGDVVPIEVIDAPRFLKLFTLCPRLRALELGTLPLGLIDPFSLPNIDTFSVSSVVSSHDLTELRRAWPNLRRLQLRGVHKVGRWDGTVIFTNLEVIACFGTGQTTFAVVPRSHMPAVHTLFLNCGSVADVDAFIDFVGSVAWDTLRVLTLAGAYVDRLNVVLHLLPGLMELRLIRAPKRAMSSLFDNWKLLSLRSTPYQADCLSMVNCEFGGDVTDSFLSFLTHRTADIVSAPVRGLVVQQSDIVLEMDDRFPMWLVPCVRRLVDRFSIADTDLYDVSNHSWI